jgi:hypothetical protein
MREALARLRQAPRRDLTLDQVRAIRREIKAIEWELCHPRHAFPTIRGEVTKPLDDPYRVIEDRMVKAAKRPPQPPKKAPPPVRRTRARVRTIGSNPVMAKDVWAQPRRTV